MDEGSDSADQLEHESKQEAATARTAAQRGLPSLRCELLMCGTSSNSSSQERENALNRPSPRIHPVSSVHRRWQMAFVVHTICSGYQDFDGSCCRGVELAGLKWHANSSGWRREFRLAVLHNWRVGGAGIAREVISGNRVWRVARWEVRCKLLKLSWLRCLPQVWHPRCSETEAKYL